MSDSDFTVVVRRRASAEQQADFESRLHGFTEFALKFPGHTGITIIPPLSGDTLYVVVDRFADASARTAFTASSEYQDWMAQLLEVSSGDPVIDDTHGDAVWFPAPADLSSDSNATTPPRWKNATVIFCGVFPVVLLVDFTIGSLLSNLPAPFRQAVFTGCVVPILTWFVMPFLTSLLRPWLYAGTSNS